MYMNCRNQGPWELRQSFSHNITTLGMMSWAQDQDLSCSTISLNIQIAIPIVPITISFKSHQFLLGSSNERFITFSISTPSIGLSVNWNNLHPYLMVTMGSIFLMKNMKVCMYIHEILVPLFPLMESAPIPLAIIGWT